MPEDNAMPMRNADPVKPTPSDGWRPSRDRERLSPAIWVAGFILAAAVIALMAALFGAA